MSYTVKDVATLTGVTIKTLYHYHKINLLVPCEITEAGYRFYGTKELERLQQILFYRELDFSLEDIKKALANDANRIQILTQQQKLLYKRKQRTDILLQTISESITLAKEGVSMDQSKMFRGLNKQEWQDALSEQKEYLQNRYDFDIDLENIDSEKLNELADEPTKFMTELAQAYRNGWRADDERVQKLIERHISFLNEKIMSMTAKSFIAEARYFVDDEFHREILEGQQLGLSSYLYTAAIIHAEHSS